MGVGTFFVVIVSLLVVAGAIVAMVFALKDDVKSIAAKYMPMQKRIKYGDKIVLQHVDTATTPTATASATTSTTTSPTAVKYYLTPSSPNKSPMETGYSYSGNHSVYVSENAPRLWTILPATKYGNYKPIGSEVLVGDNFLLRDDIHMQYLIINSDLWASATSQIPNDCWAFNGVSGSAVYFGSTVQIKHWEKYWSYLEAPWEFHVVGDTDRIVIETTDGLNGQVWWKLVDPSTL